MLNFFEGARIHSGVGGAVLRGEWRVFLSMGRLGNDGGRKVELIVDG